MNKKWNREAFYRLLRFGRKNEGGWTDAEIFWNEDTQAYDKGVVPDDNDIDILMAAPLMYEALEDALRTCESEMQYILDNGRLRGVLRAALQAAKGGDDNVG